MRINVNELSFEFKFKDDDEHPATMILKVGQFQIRGFRIMKTAFEENKKRFVLFPPANRTRNNKWIKIFWTDIKPDWELLENLALKQFNKEHEEYLLSKLNPRSYGHGCITDLDNVKF